MTRRAALALFLAAGCASPEARPPAPDDLRVGHLGHDLGTYLAIGGVRSMAGKSGPSLLLVDTVNGERRDPPIPIWVSDVLLVEGARVELHGYESGRYIGIPDEVSRITGEVAQAAWQFQHFFVATSIESGAARR